MARPRKKKPEFRKFSRQRPDFNNPPVTEVVLSLQFETIPGFNVTHLGLLWDRFRKRYPKVSTKGQLPPVFEKFETPAGRQSAQFQIVEEPEVQRCWFENATGTELIQVQPNRFIFNWKSGEAKVPYPRYEQVRGRFKSHFNAFERFLRDNELGKVIPNQCEVTYVNEIHPGPGWKKGGQLNRVFAMWSGRYSDKFLSVPDEISFRFNQKILSSDGEPLGRLYISVEPRYRIDDGKPMLRYVLTARGAPLKPTKTAVFDFFDAGREYVVRGFASTTTSRMHRIWERTDA